jgi:hypothetical protein
MSMPMLAGVGLLVVCCSSSVAAMMMGGGDVVGDFNSPAGSTATTRTHYLQFQSDGNLVWVKQGGGALWSMQSQVTMPNTKIKFQGDGNICATGVSGSPHCSQQAPGGVLTYNADVPAGQHKLVGTKEGMLYVDHGTGVAGRSVLYDPSSTTETYVLPY